MGGGHIPVSPVPLSYFELGPQIRDLRTDNLVYGLQLAIVLVNDYHRFLNTRKVNKFLDQCADYWNKRQTLILPGDPGYTVH